MPPVTTPALRSYLKTFPNMKLSVDSAVTRITYEGITDFDSLDDFDKYSIESLPKSLTPSSSSSLSRIILIYFLFFLLSTEIALAANDNLTFIKCQKTKKTKKNKGDKYAVYDVPKLKNCEDRWDDQSGPAGLMKQYINEKDGNQIAVVFSDVSMKYHENEHKALVKKAIRVGYQSIMADVIMTIRLALDTPSTHTKRLVTKWFGNSSKQTINKLRNDFYIIDSKFRKVHVMYRGSNMKDKPAPPKPNKTTKTNMWEYHPYSKWVPSPYTLHVQVSKNLLSRDYDPMQLYIGPNFYPNWWKMQRARNGRFGTYGEGSITGALFHELTHYYLGTADTHYKWPDVLRLAKQGPNESMHNAENYRCFFEEFHPEQDRMGYSKNDRSHKFS